MFKNWNKFCFKSTAIIRFIYWTILIWPKVDIEVATANRTDVGL